MSSVTGRINEIKQPRGGYLNPSRLQEILLSDGVECVDQSKENIHATLVGLAVDYLTRAMMTGDVVMAFAVSLNGATVAEQIGHKKGSVNIATELLKQIADGLAELTDTAIISTCKLVSFDTWVRNLSGTMYAQSTININPDWLTIAHIRRMVIRSLQFFRQYGPITADGFHFDPVIADEDAYQKMLATGHGHYGGYTATVESGDGDFLTADTLWDFKVSKNRPTSKHTLQLLMYWIMGQHSGQQIYQTITRLGIFNPRLNAVYLVNMSEIPDTTIQAVEKDVICYE